MNRNFIVATIIAVITVGIGFAVFSNTRTPPAATTDAIREEHHHEEKHEIELTPEKIAKAGISIETAGPATVREVVSLYGTVAPNAERVRDIAARYPGTIRTISKKVGDRVKQGEALAVIESNESLQAYTVTSPLGGVVTARNANPGEQSGDKVLLTVADLSGVWVELSLFPRDAAKIRNGQAVRVKAADVVTAGDGAVIHVSPVGTSASQTRTARVLLDNKDNQWAPGLYVMAEVTLGETHVPVGVKAAAIQNLDGADTIFVRTEKGFEPRQAKLGRSDSDTSEVLEGLRAGESYATKNSFILKAEMGKGEAAHEH
jgi:cobalt-zinc-cadmium efflux system membrane fusion protein